MDLSLLTVVPQNSDDLRALLQRMGSGPKWCVDSVTGLASAERTADTYMAAFVVPNRALAIHVTLTATVAGTGTLTLSLAYAHAALSADATVATGTALSAVGSRSVILGMIGSPTAAGAGALSGQFGFVNVPLPYRLLPWVDHSDGSAWTYSLKYRYLYK